MRTPPGGPLPLHPPVPLPPTGCPLPFKLEGPVTGSLQPGHQHHHQPVIGSRIGGHRRPSSFVARFTYTPPYHPPAPLLPLRRTCLSHWPSPPPPPPPGCRASGASSRLSTRRSPFAATTSAPRSAGRPRVCARSYPPTLRAPTSPSFRGLARGTLWCLPIVIAVNKIHTMTSFVASWRRLVV